MYWGCAMAAGISLRAWAKELQCWAGLVLQDLESWASSQNPPPARCSTSCRHQVLGEHLGMAAHCFSPQATHTRAAAL